MPINLNGPKRPCSHCGVGISPNQPGSSLSEEYGVIHTYCLYTYKYKEPVPEVLK